MDVPANVQRCVELRLLRYVIAIGEELHFGRAAKRLNLSAPALSKQIKDLEGVLGYHLFERKTREVVLTAAGVRFLTEARHALVHVGRAIENGYAASRGDTGVLSIGYSPWFRPSLLLPLRTAFAERAPGTRIILHSVYSATQIVQLLKGTLQAGIVELPTKEEDLETHCVWHDELVVALPQDHPLATRSEIDRHDLANEPIIWVAKSLNPTLHQCLVESCQHCGYTPQIVWEINTTSELFDLVGARAGIGFVKRSMAERIREPGVIFRELTGPKLFIDTGLASRADNRSDGLRTLIQLLSEQSI
jgi:DNA-binding transcriptional LysR family regulator